MMVRHFQLPILLLNDGEALPVAHIVTDNTVAVFLLLKALYF
jgi:hypothetical protein